MDTTISHVVLRWCFLYEAPKPKHQLTSGLAELPDEIRGVDRHCLPCPEEEAFDIFAHLSSWCNCTSVLHPADRLDIRVMGAYNPKSSGARCDVLVLFPIRQGYPHMVERVDHATSDYPICHRLRLCLLCILHLFY